jgi:predicted nucleic acid-binding protein
MTHLLDTNVCIVHFKSPHSGPIFDPLSAVTKSDVLVCWIVVAELLYGALHIGTTTDI